MTACWEPEARQAPPCLHRLAAAATEGEIHLADGVGVESVTRALGISGNVSMRTVWKLRFVSSSIACNDLPRMIW